MAVVEVLEAAEVSRRLGRPVRLDEVGSGDLPLIPAWWDTGPLAPPWSTEAGTPATTDASAPLLTVPGPDAP
jgi:hypothetical protein